MLYTLLTKCAQQKNLVNSFVQKVRYSTGAVRGIQSCWKIILQFTLILCNVGKTLQNIIIVAILERLRKI